MRRPTPCASEYLSLLSGTSMSAAEIARELAITQANASYHVRVLAAAGLLEETGTQRVRGGIAKLYTHPWQQQRPRQDPEGVGAMVAAMADELTRRAGLRDPAGRQVLVDAEMWVAPEVWDEVVDLTTRASDLLHAAAQRPRTGSTVHVNMTAALFAMEEDTPDATA